MPTTCTASAVRPTPYWTWSLVARRDEARETVLAVVEALTGEIGSLGLDVGTAWLPKTDPHNRGDLHDRSERR